MSELDQVTQRILQEQERRKARSEGWRDRYTEQMDEWSVALPVVYRPSQVGSPGDVRRGDKVDMVSRGTRHDSHPVGSDEKLSTNKKA